MKLPDIDLVELNKQKKQNLKDRLKFIEEYVKWQKSHSNKEWSSQQKKIIS